VLDPWYSLISSMHGINANGIYFLLSKTPLPTSSRKIITHTSRPVTRNMLRCAVEDIHDSRWSNHLAWDECADTPLYGTLRYYEAWCYETSLTEMTCMEYVVLRLNEQPLKYKPSPKYRMSKKDYTFFKNFSLGPRCLVGAILKILCPRERRVFQPKVGVSSSNPCNLHHSPHTLGS
jgi:hypothetical protein